MAFQRTKAPAKYDPAWVDRQMEYIEQALQSFEFIRLVPSTRVPVRPREGEIRLADGTDWNPGSGKGIYVFLDSGFELLGPGVEAGSIGTTQLADGAVTLTKLAAEARPGEVLLSSGTINNQAQLDLVLSSVANFATYKGFRVRLINIIPVADAIFSMRISSDGGASFDSGAAAYRWAFRRITSGASISDIGDNGDDAIDITGGDSVDNSHTGITLDAIIMRPQDTNALRETSFLGSFRIPTPDTALFHTVGAYLGLQDIDALRFFFQGTNMNTGTWGLYGIR